MESTVGQGWQADRASERVGARPWLASVVALAFGGAASVGWRAMSVGTPEGTEPSPERSAAVELWVADREAGAVIGFDRDLLELRRIALDAPVELAVRSDRGLWVLSAGPGGPVGAQTLRRLGPDGVVQAEHAFETVLDLESSDGADALLVGIEPTGVRDVRRVRGDGAVVVVESSADAFCVAGRRGQVLVGGDSGELRLHGPQPASVRVRSFGGVISDVAPGPEPGTWWVLDSHGGPNAHRLALLERDLSTRWEVPAGLAALHLCEVPGAERVWLSDASGSFARRFGPGGVREVAFAPLALVGSDRGSARSDGSVVFAAPGALLQLDPQGQPIPGQGGLEFAVDVEFVRWP